MPKVAEGKKIFNTSLPVEVIEELNHICDSLGMSRTKFVETAIRIYIQKIKDSGVYIPRKG